MWIDPHAHLDRLLPESSPLSRQGRAWFDEAMRVVKAAQGMGVSGFIIPDVTSQYPRRQSKICKATPNCYRAVGLYPGHAAEAEPGLEAWLERQVKEYSVKPIAIGEIGLDKRWDLGPQRPVFRRQLDLARALDLPVILHVVRAHAEVMAIFKQDGPPRRGVVHAFSGSVDEAAYYAKIGLYLSLSGAVTYPQARKLRRAAVAIPADRLMIETDSPDQPPAWLPDQPNSPSALVWIAAAVATLRAEQTRAVLDRSTAHIKALFELPQEMR
ncbi:TatD family hydrolase [Myxococcota bacterium]|nr:TatD family hydrolase [Myxococcota bacterium]